jgi:redox-sensitive bicupin YhaK (pirin superfamily)
VNPFRLCRIYYLEIKVTAMTTTNTSRGILKSIRAEETQEGAGVRIHRGFPTRNFDYLDPFLLLDEMGPLKFKAGQSTGFPDHPHRGFETVTYLLDGQMEHRDSFGHHGRLNSGDVQWMTAGSGLVHSEMPGADLVKNGGTLHGFQLWVNLPKRDKMTAPSYQELKAGDIPTASTPDGSVRVKVIAGESLGQHAAIGTHTPILYLHLTLQPGAKHLQEVPHSWNAFAYRVDLHEFTVFAKNGDTVELTNPDDKPIDVLLIAGEPIGDAVARYGPFVMNSKEEIYQAFEDFRAGRMGAIPA